MDYYRIRMKLEEELEREFSKISGEMTPSQLCTITNLLSAICYIVKIDGESEGMEEEYNNYGQRGGSGGGNSYNSYARGGGRSNRYGEQYGRRTRSYRDDNKTHVISTLENLMREAPSDKAREALRQAMEVIETME